MSKELRHVEVALVVNDPDHLPHKNGEQMYADDVVAELRDIVRGAVTAWYHMRGHDLLASEPIF